MKFTGSRLAYHQQMLREVAEMISPEAAAASALVNVPPRETHEWAADKVRSLLKIDTVNK